MGLIKNLDDITNAVVAEKGGTSVFVRNLGETSIGIASGWAKWGSMIAMMWWKAVLLQRGAKALLVLEQVHR